MFRREGTLDDFVIREVNGYDPLGIVPEDFVLDIGANIGAFTRLAADADAARIVAVEPDPENAKLWRQNRNLIGASMNIEFIEAAVVGDATLEKQTTMTLYTNVGKNKGMHSMLPHRGRDTVEVQLTSWRKLLALNPTVVKVDIEGGEYDLEWSDLPSSIRSLAIEFHLTKPGQRDKALAIYNTLLSQRFSPVVEKPDVSGKRWTSFYIFRRGA